MRCHGTLLHVSTYAGVIAVVRLACGWKETRTWKVRSSHRARLKHFNKHIILHQLCIIITFVQRFDESRASLMLRNAAQSTTLDP